MGLLSGMFHTSRVHNRLIIEPWEVVIGNWQLARIVGDQKKAEYILQVLSQTHLKPASPLSVLVPHRRSLLKTTLLESRNLSLMGEERKVEVEGRTLIIAAALPKESTVFDTDSRAEFDPAEALRRGYLPLNLGLVSASRGRPTVSHIATVLFEGQLKKPIYADVWLSFLPSQLLRHFYELEIDKTPFALEAPEVTEAAPSQAEERLQTATIIGSASLRDKYQLLSHYQRLGPLKFRSQCPLDASLPNS